MWGSLLIWHPCCHSYAHVDRVIERDAGPVTGYAGEERRGPDHEGAGGSHVYLATRTHTFTQAQSHFIRCIGRASRAEGGV